MRGKTFCFAFSLNDGRVTFRQDQRSGLFRLKTLSESNCRYKSNRNFMTSYYDFREVHLVMKTCCRVAGTQRDGTCALGIIKIKTKWVVIFLTTCK